MKCEAKKLMLVIGLEMLNIEWGQIDPKGHRRVNLWRLFGFCDIDFVAKQCDHSVISNLEFRFRVQGSSEAQNTKYSAQSMFHICPQTSVLQDYV